MSETGEPSTLNASKVSKASAPRNDNVWAAKVANDQDRSHILPISMTNFRIRVAQIVLAIIFLILAAFSAFTLNDSTVTGFAFSFFTFSWTFVYFVWLGLTIYKYPIGYHWIAHIIVEGLTNIFWLASWATFASFATVLNVAGAGQAITVRNDYLIGPPAAHTSKTAATTGLGPATNTAASSAAAKSAKSAAEISIAIDAAIGAVIWVLFCITLLMTGMEIVRSRRTTSVDLKGKGVGTV